MVDHRANATPNISFAELAGVTSASASLPLRRDGNSRLLVEYSLSFESKIYLLHSTKKPGADMHGAKISRCGNARCGKVTFPM